MLRYYPNGNAKARGSNLNEKMQTLISLTFHKHLCWVIYIETSKSTNEQKHTKPPKTNIHTYTYLLTSKHTNINTCIHTYTHTYIYMHKYIHTHTLTHIHIYIHI